MDSFPSLPLYIQTFVLHSFPFCSTSTSSLSLNSVSIHRRTPVVRLNMGGNLCQHTIRWDDPPSFVALGLFGWRRQSVLNSQLILVCLQCVLSLPGCHILVTKHYKNIIKINNGAGRLSAFPPTFFSHFCFLRCFSFQPKEKFHFSFFVFFF